MNRDLKDTDLVNDGTGKPITYKRWKESMEYAVSQGWAYKDADGNYRLSEAGEAVGSTVGEA